MLRPGSSARGGGCFAIGAMDAASSRQAARRSEQLADDLDPATAEIDDIEDLRAVAVASEATRADGARLRGAGEAVDVARARGRSWNHTAAALGVPRQAARQVLRSTRAARYLASRSPSAAGTDRSARPGRRRPVGDGIRMKHGGRQRGSPSYEVAMADLREAELIFEQQDEGGYCVHVPDLSGLHTEDGDSEHDERRLPGTAGRTGPIAERGEESRRFTSARRRPCGARRLRRGSVALPQRAQRRVAEARHPPLRPTVGVPGAGRGDG